MSMNAKPKSPPRYGCYLTVSLTPQEREALQQMAADRRLPVAVFVREALRREYRSNGHANGSPPTRTPRERRQPPFDLTG